MTKIQREILFAIQNIVEDISSTSNASDNKVRAEAIKILVEANALVAAANWIEAGKNAEEASK